jgi:hypothetical protein
MQWRPLLPKEGGLIQMDIGGHPPFPTSHFEGDFEGLIEGFSGSSSSMIFERIIEPQK